MTFSLFSVALGGALGASLRFLVATALIRDGFPVAILSVNVLGSLLMGVAVVALARAGLSHWQPFILTGVLGGFTTFSAFSLEMVLLIERGQFTIAALYAILSFSLGISGLLFGLTVMRAVS